MTTTLGYRDPETHRDFVIEVGPWDEEQQGHYAIEYNPETGESSGPMFFATKADIAAYGTPSARNAWIEAAELARQAHHLAAGSESGKSYDRSQAAFKAAIAAAYPELDYCGVYGVWVDCMESVAYCAATYAKLDRDDQRKFQSIGGAFL